MGNDLDYFIGLFSSIPGNEWGVKKFRHAGRCCAFEYQSCDFKSAKSEYEQTKEWEQEKAYAGIFNSQAELKDIHQIPDPIRAKYLNWRKGKVRSVHFSPCGQVVKIFIGARYSISVYNYDTHRVRLVKP